MAIFFRGYKVEKQFYILMAMVVSDFVWGGGEENVIENDLNLRDLVFRLSFKDFVW